MPSGNKGHCNRTSCQSTALPQPMLDGSWCNTFLLTLPGDYLSQQLVMCLPFPQSWHGMNISILVALTKVFPPITPVGQHVPPLEQAPNVEKKVAFLSNPKITKQFAPSPYLLFSIVSLPVEQVSFSAYELGAVALDEIEAPSIETHLSDVSM